jgi:energy-coupling factor transporter ATP-binding protein EcfA2
MTKIYSIENPVTIDTEHTASSQITSHSGESIKSTLLGNNIPMTYVLGVTGSGKSTMLKSLTSMIVAIHDWRMDLFELIVSNNQEGFNQFMHFLMDDRSSEHLVSKTIHSENSANNLHNVNNLTSNKTTFKYHDIELTGNQLGTIKENFLFCFNYNYEKNVAIVKAQQIAPQIKQEEKSVEAEKQVTYENIDTRIIEFFSQPYLNFHYELMLIIVEKHQFEYIPYILKHHDDRTFSIQYFQDLLNETEEQIVYNSCLQVLDYFKKASLHDKLYEEINENMTKNEKNNNQKLISKIKI